MPPKLDELIFDIMSLGVERNQLDEDFNDGVISPKKYDKQLTAVEKKLKAIKDQLALKK